MQERFEIGVPRVSGIGPELIDTARVVFGSGLKDSGGSVNPWFVLMLGSFALAGLAGARAIQNERDKRMSISERLKSLRRKKGDK